MADTKYTYIIASSFSNGVVTEKLKVEIQDSAIVTALLRIDTADGNCDVWFKDALSAGDVTILDGLTVAHDGIPFPKEPRPVQDKTQITSADPTLFTSIVPARKLEFVPQDEKLLFIDKVVPVGKRWYISSWDGSGQIEGFFLLEDWYDGDATNTSIDVFDDTSDWSINEKTDSITLNTASGVPYEGTGCLEWELSSSHKNDDKARIEKSYTPNLDISDAEEISLWAKGPDNDKGIAIKLYSGGQNYLFSNQEINGDWKRYSFPLIEVTENEPSLDLSAIDKIELYLYANKETTEGGTFYIDVMEKFSGIVKRPIDYFYGGIYHPHQHMFPQAIPVEAGHHVRLYVTNQGNSDQTFEVGFNGREVSVS